MRHSILVWSPIIALLFVWLSLMIPAAAATGYVGNDNAEFGFPSGLCAYGPIGASVAATASLQSNLAYTSGSPT